jgi:hypothetical protein
MTLNQLFNLRPGHGHAGVVKHPFDLAIDQES